MLIPEQMENVDLTWETTTTSNIGVDLSLLKEDLHFSRCYYKYTTNLLMDIPSAFQSA